MHPGYPFLLSIGASRVGKEPSGRLLLIKKSLLEQIFRLVEIFFRNHLVIFVATFAVTYRDKMLMQNLIPPNISLICG